MKTLFEITRPECCTTGNIQNRITLIYISNVHITSLGYDPVWTDMISYYTGYFFYRSLIQIEQRGVVIAPRQEFVFNSKSILSISLLIFRSLAQSDIHSDLVCNIT